LPVSGCGTNASVRVLSDLFPARVLATGRCEMMKANQEKKNLTGQDKSQDDLVDAGHQQTPEGLQRDRKPPLDKNVGRASSEKDTK
jgi:hypothetical protein